MTYRDRLRADAAALVAELDRSDWEGCTVREIVDRLHDIVHADDDDDDGPRRTDPHSRQPGR